MYSSVRAVILFCCVCFLGALRATAAESSPPPKVKELIVVCKTHFDIGYTDLACNVVQNYRTTMIDKALGVCDATREFPKEQQFAWTLPGWPLTQILHPEQDPTRRARIEDAIRRGRFVWHALPFTTHTESLDPEDLVRGMRFSSDLARQYGQPLPRDAKMTDVPSHARALPTILAHAGVEFLHLGCNRGSTPPEAPTLFWWEGPDGSRVMTMLVHGYGTGLQAPADWPYQTWLALIHTGDNHGPPTPDEVKKLLADAAKQYPDAKVRMGRLSDFSDAIRRENPELPVVRADMPDTWIHGIMSHPDDTAMARRVRPRIGQLEQLHTLLAGWGAGDLPEVKETVAKAYEQSLLYGEHTWGMDAKRFPRLYGPAWEAEYAKGTYAKADASWAEHGNYIRTAHKLVEPALTEHLGRLAREVSVKGPRVVVFNPLPWKRDAVVCMSQDLNGVLRDAQTGKTVATESADGLRFIARDLPPMGYKTYSSDTAAGAESTETVSIDEQQGVMDNGVLRVKIDAARGGITSIVDARTGRECVAAGEVLGQYLYQRFDADEPKRYVAQYAKIKADWIDGDFGKPGMPPAAEAPGRDATASHFDLRMESGPVSARAVLTGKPTEAIPHAVSLVITLYRDASYIDVEWSIHDKKPTPWPEAGWLCLPLAIEDAVYKLGRLGGAIVDPAKDLQLASNRDMFCLQSGLTVTGSDGSLVGICPVDSPLVSIGKPGLWQFNREFNPVKPTVYVNLFNNQWATNFSQWVGGSWSSSVRIWAGQADQADAILSVAAAETRSPALAAFADGTPGGLPSTASGLSVSRPGIMVTALGDNPDGAGTLLRIWEQAGQSGRCVVNLPRGLAFKTARPCNLRGEFSGPAIEIGDGKIECELKAFAPRSFILE